MSEENTSNAVDAYAPALQPRVDVIEDRMGITLLADIPGATVDTLDISVEGTSLTLSAQMAAALPPELESAYAEIRLPRYRHAFTLSRELDTEKIEAKLKDGVLQLRIPKASHAQPRRVEVRVG